MMIDEVADVLANAACHAFTTLIAAGITSQCESARVLTARQLELSIQMHTLKKRLERDRADETN